MLGLFIREIDDSQFTEIIRWVGEIKYRLVGEWYRKYRKRKWQNHDGVDQTDSTLLHMYVCVGMEETLIPRLTTTQ